LRILKRLEYNAADDVDHDRDPEIARGTSEEQELESVLLSKLRRAESELVTERVSRTEIRQEMDQLKDALSEAQQAKQQAEQLAASLERDLEKAITSSAVTPTSPRKSMGVVAVTENPATLQNILDPSAPIPAPPAAPLSMNKTASERAEDDHSVATIVMAQRDRLRARCEALEAERDSFKRELQGQVSASESLKLDNAKLYEKVRYLQNFSKTTKTGGAYQRSGSSLADRDLDLEALEQRYEASVDPFRQFSKAERQRKLQEMSPMERVVYIVAKTVLGELWTVSYTVGDVLSYKVILWHSRMDAHR
jgi:homeobox protein cut-like